MTAFQANTGVELSANTAAKCFRRGESGKFVSTIYLFTLAKTPRSPTMPEGRANTVPRHIPNNNRFRENGAPFAMEIVISTGTGPWESLPSNVATFDGRTKCTRFSTNCEYKIFERSHDE